MFQFQPITIATLYLKKETKEGKFTCSSLADKVKRLNEKDYSKILNETPYIHITSKILSLTIFMCFEFFNFVFSF
jgi:hypothetical protein